MKKKSGWYKNFKIIKQSCSLDSYYRVSSAENLNKLFTVLGGKFKFSAQDSDLEYLFWQRKNSPVSSDLKPPLENDDYDELIDLFIIVTCVYNLYCKNP